MKTFYKGIDITITQSDIPPYYAQIGNGTATAYWAYKDFISYMNKLKTLEKLISELNATCPFTR